MAYVMDEDEYLEHYGTKRHSGRYPWGSGDNTVFGSEGHPWSGEASKTKRSKTFLDHVATMKAEGLSETQIAEGIGVSTTQLRAAKSIAKAAWKQDQIGQAQRLKDKGWSTNATAKHMGIPEPTMRNMLKPGANSAGDAIFGTAEALKSAVERDTYIQIGAGVENYMGVSRDRLNTSVSVLREEGYRVHSVKIPQLGTKHETNVKVLAPPGTEWGDVQRNRFAIQLPFCQSDDGGRKYSKPHDPVPIDLDRVQVVYGDKGAKSDGVTYVREGVPDVSLGKSRYSQVRIQVGDGHYIKGMAMYHPDMPEGKDLVFHTNKTDTGNPLDALKPLGKSKHFPFGAVVHPIVENPGTPQERVTSAMNVLREEGQWITWKNTISSQVLSKQSPALARQQLETYHQRRKREYDEITALTNPEVRKLLLDKFANSADSAAVHLEAARLPRQNWQVILPSDTLSDNEIYAPNFKHGERVSLVRYPHGGQFEIPELTVNNKHRDSKRMFGEHPKDAVAINAKVASQLSGADFDGDTVLVIPNNRKQIKGRPPLQGLKGFDTVKAYPPYEGMPKITPKRKQQEMGDISNLITDMTILGASDTELAAAVRHSMVVIDAEKHGLNYRQSARDNGITNLKRKYQGRGNAGAATLVSRAKSPLDVPERKLRPASEGGPIDRATGRKVYVPTKATGTNRKGEVYNKVTETQKMSETDDARTLISKGNTRVEQVYADHANKMKDLGNSARLELVRTPKTKRSPTAARVYSDEVASLDAKLALAYRNKPLEKQAQIVANAAVKAEKQANPNLEDSQLKKIKFAELEAARRRTGAKKQQIKFTQREWDAVQSGAISQSKLTQILLNADLENVRQLATPRTVRVMTTGRINRAKQMLAGGATRGDVARALGVSLSTLDNSLQEGG